MPRKTIRLNGKKTTVEVADEAEPLLYVLREQCGQQGPKFGCGVAQCGACTVLVDGAIRRSCTTPLSAVPGNAEVATLDGFAQGGRLHPLQQAFIDHQAAQCAFCVNGMIVGAAGWLDTRTGPPPDEDEIRAFLSGRLPGSTFNYLCRCGAHNRIVAAIKDAAEVMAR